MNFVELLKFLPLIIGAFLAYHLIFKLQLPSKSLGNIFTYFIGIIIVFIAVGWLITTFLAGWANDLLDAGVTGAEWQQFINDSENVVDGAFNNTRTSNQTTNTQPTPMQVQIVVTATPHGDMNASQLEGAQRGPTTYTVVAGDTLTSIARRFGVTVEAIRTANNMAPGSDLIRVGDQLIIPAP